MSKTYSLKVSEREKFGRKVSQLRHAGLIPANIFGNGVKSQAIQVESTLFHKIFSSAGETGIIELVVAGKTKPRHTLVSEIQYDPITDKIVHVDFRQVKLTEKITANIPVEVEGESPAVKDLGGVFMLNLDEIEVEALPQDLPEHFLIKLGNLVAIGDTITVADLKTSEKVTIKLEDDVLVASIQAAQAEEPEEEVVETVTTVQSDATEADANTPESADKKSN